MGEHDDLNRKLVEWLGFEDSGFDGWFFRYEEPDPVTLIQKKTRGTLKRGFNFTDPIWGIALCFKWLVPPIENRGLTLSYVSFRQASSRYYAEWRIYKEKDQVKCGELLAMDWREGTDLAGITALALCKAIEILIENEKLEQSCLRA